jgi:hypothetical protein
MMYGMTGGPGADIAMMASMPLMMAQMMGKLAPVILGLGGIAIAAIALKGAFDQAQTSTIKLTEALGTGDGAVEEFAEFAGKVSAGEIMDKRRQDSLLPFSVQTGKSTFGESFIQSDQGKSMAASTRDSIAKLGRSSTESQMVTQLVNAVSSGALDAGQARSIVSNIAKEIGDTSFGLNVNAKLVELLGVNGENLLEDPLTIRLNLAEDSEKQVGIVAGQMQKLLSPVQALGEARGRARRRRPCLAKKAARQRGEGQRNDVTTRQRSQCHNQPNPTRPQCFLRRARLSNTSNNMLCTCGPSMRERNAAQLFKLTCVQYV